MTLTIRDVGADQTYNFNFQDAVVDGDLVYLGRNNELNQSFWRACNVTVTATENDWVIIVRSDGSRIRGRNFYGYTQLFQR